MTKGEEEQNRGRNKSGRIKSETLSKKHIWWLWKRAGGERVRDGRDSEVRGWGGGRARSVREGEQTKPPLQKRSERVGERELMDNVGGGGRLPDWSSKVLAWLEKRGASLQL